MVALLILAYFVIHFALYALWARNLGASSTERGIFLYHAISAACGTTLLIALSATSLEFDALVHVMVFASAHGIYSLTFLELWSLSQISFSREILACVAKHGAIPRNTTPSELRRIGDTKKAGRIDSLLRLGLLRSERETIGLTVKGVVVAKTLRLMAWIANLKHIG